MIRRLIAWALGVGAVLGAAAVANELRVGLPIGTGFAAKQLCSLVFVAKWDPDTIFERYVFHGIAPLGPMLDYVVDTEAGTVTTSALGLSRHVALHREGVGCTLVADTDEDALRAQARAIPPQQGRPRQADAPWPIGDGAPAEPVPDALLRALDRGFAEPVEGPARQTLAVLVVHRGRLVAERYANGIGPATPLMSWSMAKSVTAALVGIAVERGLLDLDAPAPVPEWQGDERSNITLRELLQMSSGLAFEEVYGPGADATEMLFHAPDMGGYAASRPLIHPPGEHWSYSSGTTNLVARILAQRLGGGLESLVAFSREALFDPLGLVGAVMEPDASGTFVGSSYMYATARDWARLGELHLRDGVWQGERILPQGWVEWVRMPAPAAPMGEYGGHFWLNAGAPVEPANRKWPSLPTDAYAMRGFSGQAVMIVPSSDLVVVRLGLSLTGAKTGIEPLVADVIAALAAGR